VINSHTPSVVAGTPSVTKTPLSQRWAATAALEEVLARLDSSTDGSRVRRPLHVCSDTVRMPVARIG